ncbi:MAG: alpha/beta hydrolase [Acidimicrobiaceae bacterium]|nr:alpha/beta hydrolase [Acidimicrobiaceae bacterium]
MVPEVVWTLPEPLSVEEVTMDDGTVIVLRRHGNPDGMRVVLCHGNGLAIDLYYPFWSLLTDEFDVVVYDLRSHGWNVVSDLSNHTFPTFVDDHDSVLEAIDDHFGEKPQVGVFHSISSMAPLLSSTLGSRYSALILFDPPLRNPRQVRHELDEAARRAAELAAKRSHRFKTREAFIDLISFSPTFKLAVPGVQDLLAKTTLRECVDGPGFELRCPREHEAQIIAHASIFAVLVDFGAMQCPIKVVGADPTLPYSYLPTIDLSEVLTVDYDFLPDATHFLQLEQPAKCRDEMREFLTQAGLI